MRAQLTTSRFPAGTVVGAYAGTEWPGAGTPGDRAPRSAALDTSTVAAAGALVFTGLDADGKFWAVAEVEGAWRWVRFSTPASQTAAFEVDDPEDLPFRVDLSAEHVADALVVRKNDENLFRIDADGVLHLAGVAAPELLGHDILVPQPTGAAAIDTPAIQVCIATAVARGGARVIFAVGMYALNDNLVLPNTTSYGPPVVMLGQGAGATILHWATDLGLGELALSYSDVNGPGTYHSAQDMTLRGPGVDNGLGVAPCDMDGVRGLNQFFMQNVRIENFRSGIVKCGDHAVFHKVQSTQNLDGVYYGPSPSEGDTVYWDCDFTGNRRASIGVIGTERISGDRFHGCHLGFSPYGIYGESGAELLIVDGLFIGCGFEAVGNALVKAAGGSRGVANATFINCPAGWSDFFKIAADGRHAGLDLTGGCSGVRMEGPATLAAVGDEAFIKATSLSGFSCSEGDLLVDAVRTAGVPFYVGAGTVAGDRLTTSHARYEILGCNGAVAQDTLVGGSNGQYGAVRPFENAAYTPALGVAGCGGDSGDGILVAIEGYVPVKVGSVGVTVYDILTHSGGDPTKVATGTAASSPIFGWATDSASADGTLANIRLRVQL